MICGKKNSGFDRYFAKTNTWIKSSLAFVVKKCANFQQILKSKTVFLYKMKYELSFCIDKFDFLCENRYEKGLISTKRKH